MSNKPMSGWGVFGFLGVLSLVRIAQAAPDEAAQLAQCQVLRDPTAVSSCAQQLRANNIDPVATAACLKLQPHGTALRCLQAAPNKQYTADQVEWCSKRPTHNDVAECIGMTGQPMQPAGAAPSPTGIEQVGRDVRGVAEKPAQGWMDRVDRDVRGAAQTVTGKTERTPQPQRTRGEPPQPRPVVNPIQPSDPPAPRGPGSYVAPPRGGPAPDVTYPIPPTPRSTGPEGLPPT